MRKIAALVSLFFVVGCGLFEGPEGAPGETIGGCTTEQLEEGLQFTCLDQEGNESTGIVRHGETGATGERGPQGERGEAGEGLAIAEKKACTGAIEGWLENSAYEVRFQRLLFSTGDRFLSSIVELHREGEVINARTASMFALELMPHDILSDGLFVMRYVGGKLHVTSQGGVDVELDCEVVE